MLLMSQMRLTGMIRLSLAAHLLPPIQAMLTQLALLAVDRFSLHSLTKTIYVLISGITTSSSDAHRVVGYNQKLPAI